ncbi:MAG: UPF0158 family protein [Rhabdochlamydiaceae bacterium]
MSKLPMAQNPLIIRYHRLLDAFAKSDDERDFYLDKVEGFLVYCDLDKGHKELEELELELKNYPQRYCLIPKMTYYETKKFMESFVNEKVYDIDTKEKLLDVIQSKEARENFIDFIYDHLSELEKWQQYYVERSRIRVIEWLRLQNVQFVFEEDLELTKNTIEKLKKHLFDPKVPKDVQAAREVLVVKAKTYYSNEALNPRPKRGRPPKQAPKVEVEPQITADIYTTVPPSIRTFLYLPDITSPTSISFSSRFERDAQSASLRGSSRVKVDSKLQALSERLESLRHISSKLTDFKGLDELLEDQPIQRTLSHLSSSEDKKEENNSGKITGLFKGLSNAKKEKREVHSDQLLADKGNQPKILTPLNKKKKEG